MDDLPLEIIWLIAGESRLVYHPLILAYPRFARSLTLGDRLDYAEVFGYDCRVIMHNFASGIEWCLNGQLHRTDGPAVDRADGSKCWYLNGQYHRTNGPAAEFANGSKLWYIMGQLHRTDGPAAKFDNGSKYWYLNGRLHRIDGPAIERADGSKRWYLNGRRYPYEEFIVLKQTI